MPYERLLRPHSVLASVLAAAGVVFAVASCSHITPLGPGPTPVPTPPPRHLGSPIIIQVMRNHPASPTGECPAGWVTVSGPAGGGPGRLSAGCYRAVGTPVTITSAGVSSVSTFRQTPPPGQPAPPTQYGFWVGVPSAHVAAVTALIRQAYNSRSAFGISVAGKLWQAPRVDGPFAGSLLQIAFPSRNQALQLYRILVPSG